MELRKDSNKEGLHWLSLLGSCASIICVIHCFGTALLSLVAPAFLHLLPHSEMIELGVWFFACFCALFTFWRLSPSRIVWPPLLAIIFVGSVLFLDHKHREAAWALFVLAFYQLAILGVYHFGKSNKKPPCCKNENSSMGE